MGTATRDFIPEGENLTPNEFANRNRQAAIRTGAHHDDFIPDPSANEPTKRATSTPEERADRAMAAAVARAKAATDADWDIAISRLAGWNARQAIETIQRMPQQVMELYIVAEEASGHRNDILSVFPTPRPDMYKRYAPELFAEKFGDGPVEAPVAAGEPAPVALDTSLSDVPTPELEPSSSVEVQEAPTPEVPVEPTAPEAEAPSPEEVFLCFDCTPPAEYKTLAGLKSHGRAKHGDVEEKADETPQAAEEVAPQAGAQE